ncbi:MAG: DUF6382 domain-containing protein [Bilifractor sp.]|nr:DUF6382 domain-containing protein [Lachnospiraceae bacterium]MDY2838097.1 DUF6382 domain-containing protein [Bilifractor sp.]
MKIESSRDLCHNYRILSEGKTPDRSSYIVRMLTENHIPGFLECHIQEIDVSTRYLYDVTSRQSLEDILATEKITGQFLELLYSSLLASIHNLEEFLLDENGIQLRPDLIFLNAERTRIYFIYYPDEEESFSDQLKILGETMLPHLDHGDRKSVIMGYAFYQKASAGELCAEDFEELLAECRPRPELESLESAKAEEKERKEQREKILDEFFEDDDNATGDGFFSRIRNWFSGRKGQDENFVDEGPEEVSGAVRDRKRKERGIRPELSSEDFSTEGYGNISIEKCGTVSSEGYGNVYSERYGKVPSDMTGKISKDMREEREEDTSVDEDGGKETVLLTAASQEAVPKALAMLVPEGREQHTGHRTEDGQAEAIVLWKTNHILGKSRKAADLIVSVATVSRIHARFVYREAGYDIIDLNSKNGTFRNGEMLTSGETYPLKDGDQLCFSDQRYTYHATGIVQQPPKSV